MSEIIWISSAKFLFFDNGCHKAERVNRSRDAILTQDEIKTSFPQARIKSSLAIYAAWPNFHTITSSG